MKDYSDKQYASFFEISYSKPIQHEFYDFYETNLPISIDPQSFLDFLAKQGEDITGNYSIDVCSMCEYSCCWIISESIKQGFTDLCVCSGNYGYGEHFWISYKDWFIDLTLAQFIPNAPKLSITKRSEAVSISTYRNYYEYTTKEYMKEILGIQINDFDKFFLRMQANNEKDEFSKSYNLQLDSNLTDFLI